jgi:hypothetical protein
MDNSIVFHPLGCESQFSSALHLLAELQLPCPDLRSAARMAPIRVSAISPRQGWAESSAFSPETVFW